MGIKKLSNQDFSNLQKNNSLRLTQLNASSTKVATGGTITYIVVDNVRYAVHSFTAEGSNDFTITSGVLNIEYLIVGAGGSGGTNGRGGGGGGGVVSGSATNLKTGTYKIWIGKAFGWGSNGLCDAEGSKIGGIAQAQGGQGGDDPTGGAAGTGGGAGGTGGVSNGSNGSTSSITGTSTYYGGGGAGGLNKLGGLGGGGNSSVAGTSNTGGGGGGGNSGVGGGQGGSGIVIVRYIL
jgi:hypothetical protein